ncbi:modifier of mdg4-like isoform X13 [Anopheles funestus]|uniref:modifier of mdg4-like isoform X13 n=1 Tax=Anopheles funestus TaxID=62324 RepID=UPI0020C60DED|nr:modifier of mdg4-like isoform X13 [Anopheles funestus]
MADDEQFSLCWNNFNSNLSAGFHESLQRGDLVDVTLAAEGQLVQAHRLVLSVCSPYFRKMFNQMPKNQHAFVFLKDVTHAALQDLIQFMYCGEVNVKQDALPAFISTAEALQIKGLTETGDSAPPQQSPAKEEVSAVPATTASISTTVPAASQRIKSQRNRVQSYKIESEESGDDKIVHIQASTSHHVSAQQLQAQTNISSQKRTMSQRGVTSHAMKRPKISISASSDGMDTSDNTHTPAQAQTVQTVQIVKQIPAQVIEPEYIELPMESINPKAEPDYTDETAEIETVDAETEQEHKLSEHDQGDGDDDGHYVEDETYGDMAMGKYEESYLTEGEDGAKPGASGFVDSYTSDGGTGTEQSTQVHNEGIVGFCFPLSCHEDVERLESSVRMSPMVRTQYIRYLASKKSPGEPVSKCFKLFFSHWSVYNFSLHNDEQRAATDCKKQYMKEYKIFTDCMMEAWKSHGLSEPNLINELQIALTAAYENNNQSHYKRRKRSELIQMMLRQRQTKLTK